MTRWPMLLILIDEFCHSKNYKYNIHILRTIAITTKTPFKEINLAV